MITHYAEGGGSAVEGCARPHLSIQVVVVVVRHHVHPVSQITERGHDVAFHKTYKLALVTRYKRFLNS